MSKTRVLSLTLLLLAGLPAIAQDPAWLEDGQVVELTAAGGLEAQIRELSRQADGRVWLAYTVPMIAGDENLCCHDWRGGRPSRTTACSLDGESLSIHSNDDRPRVPLDSRRLRVTLRLDRGRVRTVGSYSASCRLNAKGERVYVLNGVGADESVAVLSDLVESGGSDASDEALTSIAFHDGASATSTLEGFAQAGSRDEIRSHSAFWLANTRGADSLPLLTEMVREDQSEDVREETVFAISLVESPQAADALIDLARHGESEVRSLALFWLSQKAGEEAVDAIHDAIEDDPDSDVREHAVFALSQLPPERSVPLLIDLARTHRHPDVRRQAMFWLGQTDDPRALEFFEDVLSR